MINAISTAISGLAASMKRLGASASNIANFATTGSLEEGGKPPYSPKTVQQVTVADRNGNSLGVHTVTYTKDPAFVPAFDPDSPFADSEGNIGVPNVSLAEEAVNLKIAELAYKANLMVIRTEEEMQEALMKSFDRKV